MSHILHDQNVFPGVPMKHLKKIWKAGTKCKACQRGKFSHGPFHLSSLCATRPFKLIHTDLVGPINPDSYYRSRYFMVLLDDCTCYTWVFCLCNKSDTLAWFQKFVAHVSNNHKSSIGILRLDNGGKFMGNDFK